MGRWRKPPYCPKPGSAAAASAARAAAISAPELRRAIQREEGSERGVLKLDDVLLTLKLTPNLAHGLSVYGIARELAALTGAPLSSPSITPVPATLADNVPVKVEAPELCGRFSGRIVRKVNTQVKTPQWMVDRLARCGQRPVSPLVTSRLLPVASPSQPPPHTISPLLLCSRRRRPLCRRRGRKGPGRGCLFYWPL